MEKYCSREETLDHIRTVGIFINRLARELLLRASKHDTSKLLPPEKEMFDEVVGTLKGLTYGSEEYQQALKDLQPALKHHYENNSHHPEHYENGIDDMCLIDVIEMFADWCAATHRHDDGDIRKSIEHNKGRFEMSEQLARLFKTTANKYAMGKNN